MKIIHVILIAFAGMIIISAASAKWTFYEMDMEKDWFRGCNQIAFDSSGNVYVATNYGVMAYEGGEWKRYSPVIFNNSEHYPRQYKLLQTYTIEIDGKNNIWVGTDRGIVKYNRENWFYYDTASSNIKYPIMMTGLCAMKDGVLYKQDPYHWGRFTENGDTVFDMREYGDHLMSEPDIFYYEGGPWFYNCDSVFQIKNNNVYSFNSIFAESRECFVGGFIAAGDEGFWIKSYGFGYYKYSKGRWTPFVFPDTGRFSSGNWSMEELAEGKDGTIWLTAYKHLSEFNRECYLFKITPDGKWSEVECHSCFYWGPAVDSGGRLWLLKYDAIHIYEEEPASAQDPAAESAGLRVWPNPSQNIIEISAEEPKKGVYQVQILSSTGEVMITQLVKCENQKCDEQINISSLGSGSYIVKIIDEKGISKSLKFVKTR
ncbi:MAG: T9SS type A sorting domain-containing protein [Candidatus Kapaibacterium sp.]